MVQIYQSTENGKVNLQAVYRGPTLTAEYGSSRRM